MLCVTGLCEGNSPVTGEFPSQRASNAENASFWWSHHGTACYHRHWYNFSQCNTYCVYKTVITLVKHGSDCTPFPMQCGSCGHFSQKRSWNTPYSSSVRVRYVFSFLSSKLDGSFTLSLAVLCRISCYNGLRYIQRLWHWKYVEGVAGRPKIKTILPC